MNKHIARKIALAQRASDFGKYYKLSDDAISDSVVLGSLLGDSDDNRAYKYGYRMKDQAILDAVMGISHNPNSGFHFRVTIDDEKLARFIVYFDFRVIDERIQVSFHSFDKRLARYVEKARSGHWDRSSARKACISLLQSLQ